jgi:hypothetical protein
MNAKRSVTLIGSALLVALIAAPLMGQIRPPAQQYPIKPEWDIKLHDVWVDASSCQLWVSYTNLGTKTITQTLQYQVKVDGVQVDTGMMAFNLAPGAFFSHGVGTTQNPVKIHGTRTAFAHIDVTQVLAEPSSRRANNMLTKSVQGCRLPIPKVPIEKPKP